MILVTGCAGFIGSNICHYLAKVKKTPIIGIDKLTAQSNFSWIAQLERDRQLSFYQIDICNPRALDRLFAHHDITHVIHMAAETHVDRSIKSPEIFWNTNVMGTFHLLQAAFDHGVQKFVQNATDELYGEKPNGEAKEGDQLFPTQPYSCSKAGQYYVGHSFMNTYQFPVISAFPVNCFGPRQHIEKIIPRFLHNLLVLDEPVPLMASTHFQRDWLPVEDLCAAIDLLLESAEPGDYNIGANNHRTNLQLTHEILELCGKDPSAYIKIVPDRKAHDSRYAVNSDKIKALGWKPQHEFMKYLESTVNWYGELWKV